MYAAAKGAVQQIVRVLSKDLGAKGLTVNAIAPGPVDTDLFNNGKSEQLIQFFANMHPQKRIPSPDEISPIAAFLARDESGWVNGQTIFVNGVSGYLRFHLSSVIMTCCNRDLMFRCSSLGLCYNPLLYII